ncbi:MAG: hypothetical protein LBM23_07785 [Propionibacteriaceae bacterium]|nr:hypothetical protein [Propionibacteriaceae bacterium]
MNNQQALVVFLDANVLNKPATRSLIMFAALEDDFVVTWSQYVEHEADRHLRSIRQLSVKKLRAKENVSIELAPAGNDPSRFTRTSHKDQQVLADAAASGAHFIITEDVDDFGQADLESVSIAAINPDLFLAACVSDHAYAAAVTAMAATMSNPSLTAQQLHTKLGRQHPLTVEAHRAAFESEPMPAANRNPAVLFRGRTLEHVLNRRMMARIRRFDRRYQ